MMPAGQDLDDLCGWPESVQPHQARPLFLIRAAQAEVNFIKSPEAQKCPISSIPNELLISIFALFVQDLDQDDSGGEDKLCHWRPVILSHVCRRWRLFALSTSCLWSRIILSRISPVSAVDHFINHAGVSAIDVFGHGVDNDQLTQLLSLKYLPRWKTIGITTAGSFTMVALLRSLYEPVIFSNLSTLKLSSDPPRPGHGTFFHGLPSPPHSSDRFPALRHVQLVEVPVYSVPVGIFRNIHTLELSNSKQGLNPLARFHPSLLNVLSTARHLEHLILSDFTPFIDHGSDPVGGGNNSPTIVLPLLREFIWYYPEVRVLRHFFSHVSTPRLRNADFSVKCNKTTPHNITPFAFRFPFVEDLTIECDAEETLYSATREMEFPIISHLIIQTSIDNWDPTSPLPVFRWSTIFRDLRVPYLTHLTLFRLSITLDHMGGVLQYMPSLKSLTCDMYDGVASMVCAISTGDCACAVGAYLRGDQRLFELESLTFRDCDGLRIVCFQNWISVRNGQGESRHSAVNRIRDYSMTQRKIKPLSGKYKRRLRQPGITPSISPIVGGLEGLSLAQSSPMVCYIPNYLHKPSKIAFISFDNCNGVTEANARELQRLGVDAVEWK